MTTAAPMTDSLTMLRRNLRHALRYPSMTLSTAAMPLVFLLLFVYVLGGAISAGLHGGSYLNYLVPGILIMTVASGSLPTAVSVCSDMAEGIVARFRIMAIARTSLLTGHVVGSLIQTVGSLVLVLGVAALLGFRSPAGPLAWLAVAGVLVLLTLALTWLAVGIGLSCKKPETASNVPLPLTMLPFLGSGFVPTDTMPTGLRWFAEYQPFTPVIETIRGLLAGTPVGATLWIALGWCVAIAVVCYLWSRRRFDRDPTPR